LAQKILQSKNREAPVLIYGGYFQDVPVYLQRRIILVDDLVDSSELKFGTDHQNMKGWLIRPDDFWINLSAAEKPEWVLMQVDTYASLSPNQKAHFEIEGKTEREILLKTL